MGRRSGIYGRNNPFSVRCKMQNRVVSTQILATIYNVISIKFSSVLIKTSKSCVLKLKLMFFRAHFQCLQAGGSILPSFVSIDTHYHFKYCIIYRSYSHKIQNSSCVFLTCPWYHSTQKSINSRTHKIYTTLLPTLIIMTYRALYCLRISLNGLKHTTFPKLNIKDMWYAI